METKDKRAISSIKNGKLGGVKTDEGKKISSQNSITHGIFCRMNTTFDDISFEDVYREFADEFGDETISRQALISHLSVLYIRLRRCLRFETEYLKAKLNPPKFEEKLVKEGIKIDELLTYDEYVKIQTDPGEPMTLDPVNLNGLENLYMKYEAQFLGRFCTIVDILSRGIK